MSDFQISPCEGSLIGQVTVPGDKSISHRALLFSLLSETPVLVRGLGTGADNQSTLRAVQQLGAQIEHTEDGIRIVAPRELRQPDGPIDCGNSGTTMRLLTGLLSGQRFRSTLVGDASLSSRPMARIATPLEAMGAQVSGVEKDGNLFAPLQVGGGSVQGIHYELPVASAQVKSAILLAGLYGEGTTSVTEPGPSRNHTELMLQSMGAPIEITGRTVKLDATRGWDGRLSTTEFAVPADPSSAAFVIAAALLCGAERVSIPDVCINPTRTGFLDVLASMGANIERQAARTQNGEAIADLVVSRGGEGDLSGTVVEGDLVVRSIDELPILAVCAAFAHGITYFRDAAELRVKESDRIVATCAMLEKLGIDTEQYPDGFSVKGNGGSPFQAKTIDSFGDHRIAMSAAIAGLKAEAGILVKNVNSVDTSFPGFAAALSKIGAPIVARN